MWLNVDQRNIMRRLQFVVDYMNYIKYLDLVFSLVNCLEFNHLYKKQLRVIIKFAILFVATFVSRTKYCSRKRCLSLQFILNSMLLLSFLE